MTLSAYNKTKVLKPIEPKKSNVICFKLPPTCVRINMSNVFDRLSKKGGKNIWVILSVKQLFNLTLI